MTKKKNLFKISKAVTILAIFISLVVINACNSETINKPNEVKPLKSELKANIKQLNTTEKASQSSTNIFDEDGTGKIVYNNQILEGGELIKGQENVYEDKKDKNVNYILDKKTNTLLIINLIDKSFRLTINDFYNGKLSIKLSNEENHIPEIKYQDARETEIKGTFE